MSIKEEIPCGHAYIAFYGLDMFAGVITTTLGMLSMSMFELRKKDPEKRKDETTLWAIIEDSPGGAGVTGQRSVGQRALGVPVRDFVLFIFSPEM